jgi:hypothetical protein
MNHASPFRETSRTEHTYRLPASPIRQYTNLDPRMDWAVRGNCTANGIDVPSGKKPCGAISTRLAVFGHWLPSPRDISSNSDAEQAEGSAIQGGIALLLQASIYNIKSLCKSACCKSSSRQTRIGALAGGSNKQVLRGGV